MNKVIETENNKLKRTVQELEKKLARLEHKAMETKLELEAISAQNFYLKNQLELKSKPQCK